MRTVWDNSSRDDSWAASLLDQRFPLSSDVDGREIASMAIMALLMVLMSGVEQGLESDGGTRR